MKSLVGFFLVILTVSSLQAQKIYFCLNYTESGEPLRVSNSWSIGSDSGYLMVLYQQPDEIQKSEIFIAVSEERNGSFAELSRYHIVPDPAKNWVAGHIRFAKGGDYKVSVLKYDSVMASEYLTIHTKKTKAKAGEKFTSHQWSYYAGTSVIACTGFDDGVIQNVSATFDITNDTSQVMFIIQSDQKLDYEKLNIDIYKRNAPCYDYLEFVESKRITPEYEKSSAYFTLKFSTNGEYKVCIYDIDMIRINTGYVTINSK
jgi:hypothetical protein